MRGVTGFLGTAGMFTAIQYTTLSKASILFWTMPIWCAFYAKFFLNETLSYFDWVAMFCAFLGIVLI